MGFGPIPTEQELAHRDRQLAERPRTVRGCAWCGWPLEDTEQVERGTCSTGCDDALSAAILHEQQVADARYADEGWPV